METGKGRRDTNTRKRSLAAPPQITHIKLADGKVYKLAPLTLNKLVDFEEHFEGQAAGELLATGKLLYIRYLVWLRLKDAYDPITEERVGELITAEVLNDIQATLGA